MDSSSHTVAKELAAMRLRFGFTPTTPVVFHLIVPHVQHHLLKLEIERLRAVNDAHMAKEMNDGASDLMNIRHSGSHSTLECEDA